MFGQPKTLKDMAKYAEVNRKLLRKALGKSPKEKINPVIQYAHANKK